MSATDGRTGAKRDIEDIIQTCGAIENRKINPFLLDVMAALRILRQHSASLRSIDDYLLDMRALSGIAKVVGLQSANLRFQSSSLFIDPETAKQKVVSLSRQQLMEFFLLSWHPIVEFEQLTSASLKEAIVYWQRLLSFFERRRRMEQGSLAAPGQVGVSELTDAGLIEARDFNKLLIDTWEEMKQRTPAEEEIEYWSFVRTPNFSQTVERAQLVSFLVSYGYATMEAKHGKIILSPNDTPLPPSKDSPVSLPIPIPKQVSKT